MEQRYPQLPLNGEYGTSSSIGNLRAYRCSFAEVIQISEEKTARHTSLYLEIGIRTIWDMETI